MLLSQITVDPDRYQLRDAPYSEQTVTGIVAGFDAARFDPLPIIAAGDGQYIVAGDGHSRYEAIRRLAERAELPDAWAVGDDWDIPCRLVDAEQAATLRFANLSRANLTACEEAKAFALLVEEGMSIADIARLVHRTEDYIRKALPLNCLCHDIRQAVGRPVDGGGITVETAKAMAAKFEQYGIGHKQQQELWHKVFAHTDCTPAIVRDVIDRIGKDLGGSSGADGFLFELPASVPGVLRKMKSDMEQMRRAKRALSQLLASAKAGVLAPFPDLDRLVKADAERIIGLMEQVTETHGAELVLSALGKAA